jgi:uncharacterized protein YndB with AHSA1/START domain
MRSMTRTSCRIVFASLLLSTASAEVTRSSDAGFTITHSVNVPMPPPAAWSALADIGRWWDPEHTYSGDSRNLSLQPYVGGCFCERWGMYNGVQHMTVVSARPPKSLRLSGGLGPLQELAVNGVLTWTIDAAGGGSKIGLTYTVGGYSEQSLSAMAPLVDSVLVIQMQRLGRFISTGNPEDLKTGAKSETKK